MYSIIFGNTEKNAIIALQKFSYENVNLSCNQFKQFNQIEDFTLAVFKTTRILSMDNKSIRYLGENPFFGLMYLKYLDLSHNNLESIHANAFECLVSLTELKLNNNALINVNNLFNSFKNLVSLDLSANKIQMLYDNVLCGSLKNLNLSGNGLNRIWNNAFCGLVHLETLVLSENELSRHHGSIRTRVFNNLTSLKLLDISDSFSYKVKGKPFGLFEELNLSPDLVIIYNKDLNFM